MHKKLSVSQRNVWTFQLEVFGKSAMLTGACFEAKSVLEGDKGVLTVYTLCLSDCWFVGVPSGQKIGTANGYGISDCRYFAGTVLYRFPGDCESGIRFLGEHLCVQRDFSGRSGIYRVCDWQ